MLGKVYKDILSCELESENGRLSELPVGTTMVLESFPDIDDEVWPDAYIDRVEENVWILTDVTRKYMEESDIPQGVYMKVWKKSKGNRIRASDKSLVYHFCIGWLLLLFVAVFLLLNLRQLLVTDWTDFNLLHAGITWTAYNSITVLIATGVCALVAFLYYRYGYDSIKRLLHRQKLARIAHYFSNLYEIHKINI